MDDSIRRVPPTSFELVSDMNTAFGNPKGDSKNIDWGRVRNQCKNIGDEFVELMTALGADRQVMKNLGKIIKHHLQEFPCEVDIEEVRDALCDISVFSLGAQHLMGVNGDADMAAVVDGVMTRFCCDQAELDATIAHWANKGIPDIYVEGEFPRKIVKSASDQPDAPKGKFLKSVGYSPTVFPPLA